MDSLGIAPRSSACGADVFLLDHEPELSGSRGTRTHKSRMRPTVFKTGSSSGRMTSVTSCGSWNRTNIKTFRASRPTVRRSRKGCSASSGGRNRTYGLLVQSQASLPTATTPEWVALQECPAGVEPASPAWKAGTSAARPRAREAEGVRVEPTRLVARLFSRQLPSPIGLPFRYELRRQESNLRGYAFNRRLPVPARCPTAIEVSAVGFEPTISCFRSRRNCQAFPYADRKSAQRESNPHIRHGKAVGCRYIMGACFAVNSIVKEQRAPGRTRTDVAALRVRNLGR